MKREKSLIISIDAEEIFQTDKNVMSSLNKIPY